MNVKVPVCVRFARTGRQMTNEKAAGVLLKRNLKFWLCHLKFQLALGKAGHFPIFTTSTMGNIEFWYGMDTDVANDDGFIVQLSSLG